jgi:predicted dehydrogenase
MKLAMIGARGHYKTVLRELPDVPDVRVVGVSDGSAEDSAQTIVKWCRENGHSPAVMPDWRAMLDATRPDALIVCGPFELHAAMCVEAIGRGIHVLVEKPAALTMDDLAAVRDALHRRPHVHLAAMMFSRYTPGFYTAWRLIRDGAVGDVRLIDARKSYQLGHRAAYYHDRATYGGTIPWVGSHAIDWVLWLGGHKVESVYAVHSSAHNAGCGTMERAALCHLTLCDGRAASVSIDVFRPETAPTHGDDWARVVGTTGVIEVRPDSVTLVNGDNDGTKPVPVSCARTPLRDFVDHVSGRRTALIGRDATLDATAVCLLARQSADEGRVISVAGE